MISAWVQSEANSENKHHGSFSAAGSNVNLLLQQHCQSFRLLLYSAGESLQDLVTGIQLRSRIITKLSFTKSATQFFPSRCGSSCQYDAFNCKSSHRLGNLFFYASKSGLVMFNKMNELMQTDCGMCGYLNLIQNTHHICNSE